MIRFDFIIILDAYYYDVFIKYAMVIVNILYGHIYIDRIVIGIIFINIFEKYSSTVRIIIIIIFET